ncbi:hypothetical protein [Rhizobium leguminosarum]|uniref:hypothetical protein n=1 Tax=Rhizobium leguminosarum TaxID=384 RepID=UPI002E0E773B|nr:hypothetical protein U8Q02_40525 [Rhizobium leguminosarum]
MNGRFERDPVRGEQLRQIMEDAVQNTLARQPSLRGPYVISDDELRSALEARQRGKVGVATASR